MPDSEKEFLDIEATLLSEMKALLPDLLSGEIARTAPPSPDFCLVDDARTIGIEFTRVYDGSNDQGGSLIIRSESLYRTITERIKKMFEGNHTQTVYVTFHWDYRVIPNRKEQKLLINAVIDAISMNIPSAEYEQKYIASEEIDNELLWDYLSGFTIMRIPFQSDMWGTAGPTMWIGTGIEPITECIVRKEEKLDTYKAYCNECWLIIVADGVSLASSIFSTASVAEHLYRTNYTRILFYNRIYNQVVDLKVIPT